MKRFFDKDVVKITYIAVFIFIFVYVIIQILPFQLSTSWQPVALAIAILFAAPLIFSLLWERLTSFKALGVEIGLADVVQKPCEATILEQTTDSVEPEILKNFVSIINQANVTKLVKINLGKGQTWRIFFMYLNFPHFRRVVKS